MRVGWVGWSLLLLLPLFVAGDVSQSANNDNDRSNSNSNIADLILVDTATGRDLLVLQNDTIIDTQVYGVTLTLRAALRDDSSSSTNDENDESLTNSVMVEWNLDAGKTLRIESVSPFALAGKGIVLDTSNSNSNSKTIEYYPSNLLVQPGMHTVSARTVSSAIPNDQVMQYQQNDRRHRRRMQHTPGALTVQFSVVNGKSNSDSDSSGVITADAFTTTTTTTTTTDTDNNNDNNDHAVAASAQGSVTVDPRTGIVTIGFRGPLASETGTTEPSSYSNALPSTFADYRLDVDISSTTSSDDSATITTVPCYYAGSGNAAWDHTVSGSVWLCHFRPTTSNIIATTASTTTFTYTVTFRHGTNAAVSNSGDPAGFMDGATGTFQVDSSSFLSTLASVEWQPPQYQLGLATNLFDYAGYDGTNASSWNYDADYATSSNNSNNGTTTTTAWSSGGANLLGALQYMHSVGGWNAAVVNPLATASTSGNNSSSTGGVVTPFVDNYYDNNDNDMYYNYKAYDISKLAQWQIVLDAAWQMGYTVYLQMDLDDYSFFTVEQQQLLDRELRARFGHYPNLVWDDDDDSSSNNVVFVSINDVTVTQVWHAWMEQDRVLLTADSNDNQDFTVHSTRLQSIQSLANVLRNDGMPTPLWSATDDVIVAVTATGEAVDNAECWSDANQEMVLIHYYDHSNDGSSTHSLQLLTVASSSYNEYSVQWYDMTQGGALETGSVTQVSFGNSGSAVDVGSPPSTTTSDWLVVLKKL